ncbi:MAG: hypothetical protein EPN97_05795 [Alphaproteobacteria bacterium]|nr:MAG: hypothetical protein EPN97_05795 [Alphaproteobacteria bacterium]
MPHKNATNGNAAVKTDDIQMRVTSARSFYRNAPASKAISLVKTESSTDLSSKEYDCCSRATD